MVLGVCHGDETAPGFAPGTPCVVLAGGAVVAELSGVQDDFQGEDFHGEVLVFVWAFPSEGIFVVVVVLASAFKVLPVAIAGAAVAVALAFDTPVGRVTLALILLLLSSRTFFTSFNKEVSLTDRPPAEDESLVISLTASSRLASTDDDGLVDLVAVVAAVTGVPHVGLVIALVVVPTPLTVLPLVADGAAKGEEGDCCFCFAPSRDSCTTCLTCFKKVASFSVNSLTDSPKSSCTACTKVTSSSSSSSSLPLASCFFWLLLLLLLFSCCCCCSSSNASKHFFTCTKKAASLSDNSAVSSSSPMRALTASRN